MSGFQHGPASWNTTVWHSRFPPWAWRQKKNGRHVNMICCLFAVIPVTHYTFKWHLKKHLCHLMPFVLPFQKGCNLLLRSKMKSKLRRPREAGNPKWKYPSGQTNLQAVDTKWPTVAGCSGRVYTWSETGVAVVFHLRGRVVSTPSDDPEKQRPACLCGGWINWMEHNALQQFAHGSDKSCIFSSSRNTSGFCHAAWWIKEPLNAWFRVAAPPGRVAVRNMMWFVCFFFLFTSAVCLV